MRTLNPTAIKIADLAEHYIQTRGFNGFSFRDIQNELGIKTASIHYHFKTKQDLANTVLERYLHRYQAQLTRIYQQHEQAKSMLSAFADEFMQTHQSNKLCLCGMFASDLYSLSKDVVMPLNRFVDINHAWLVSVLKHGITSGEFQQDISPEQFAKIFFSSLEGSLLMAQFRTSDDIKEVTNSLIASITETAPSQN
ncbi:TetR/AcrR family transcriptional regulator [Vibrio caribbeanicus]|uniref:TetR/AcrR family transcriptional regulator n=1 Tax=Vibrio caribbeanicus TaxID=701175 RepID=UPI0022842C83|nr:TetR/AcrR family transcriptional regulator [Vibrio caribbeanicus]MCY9843040.1 TetR/AcrR family transcriptional regulator [Vibrio caribbeanicus]